MTKGHTGPFGRRTAELKTSIDEVTRAKFIALAEEAGVSVSDFLYELVLIRLHGVSHLVEAHANRLESIAGPDFK